MTPKDMTEGNSEASVHEAVCDRVTAGGEVSKELDERDSQRTDHVVESGRAEEVPGVHDVEGGPADEELGHDHAQHLNHPLLPPEGLSHVAPSKETCRLGGTQVHMV